MILLHINYILGSRFGVGTKWINRIFKVFVSCWRQNSSFVLVGIHRIRKVKFPTLWYFRVTSIALRALHFTLDTFWAELLYVPQDTVNRLALWLCKKQYLEGYWVEESIIYDRNMKVQVITLYYSFHLFSPQTKLALL